MAEQAISLPWPFGGKSETFSPGNQEPSTAREYKNVRGLTARTGRLQGGKRNGLSKYLSSPLKAQGTKVADLTAFFTDNRQVSYAAIASGSETVTWDATTPSKTDCLNVKTDRQGNVYALNGDTGIVKLSADEEELWQIALPVKDENHLVRALWVDEFDRVFAAVSANGRQDLGRLWCYEQLPENKFEILFEIELKSYVEDIVTAQDKLYTIHNEPDRARAYVRVYDQIDSTSPQQVQEWRVPFPVNSLAVKKDGSVFVACEASGDSTNYWRLPDPKFPNFSVDSVDWTPYQLANFDKRVWSWYVADDIDATDVASDLEDGVEILRWRDRTKNGRHFYSEMAIGSTSGADIQDSPHLAFEGLCSHKAVRFDKPGTGGASTTLQALRTLPNSTYAKEFADQQATMAPAYTGSQFAIYIVCRPSETGGDGDVTPRWLWGQDRDNTSSNSRDHILFVNTDDNNTVTLPPTGDAGGVYWFTGQPVVDGDGPNGGGGPSILKGDFDVKPGTATVNPGNFCIICLVCDGNVSTSPHKSIFQINGNPIDEFDSLASFTLEPSYLGVFKSFGSKNPSGGAAGFLGDILEILVLDRKSRSDDTQGVLSFQALEWDSAPQSQIIDDNTTIVGYLAHKYGAQLNLPFGTAAGNNYPHPFGKTGSTPDFLAGPPNQAGTAVSDAQAKANKSFACVVKYTSDGKIVWTANEMASGDGSRPGGFGYAVAVNSDGNVYSMGPNPTSAGGVQQVRLIIDQGSTFSISSGDGAWSAVFPSNAEQDYHYPKVDVDEFDNLYIPYNEAGNAASFRVYKKDGTVLHSKLLSASQSGYAVAVDRRIPDYRNDLSASVKRAEHVIVATSNEGTTSTATLHKVRLVAATQAAGAPRSLTTLGVSGGDIVKFTTSAVTTPTGGSGALDSTARYTESISLFKLGYWTDGRQYRKYDSITDTVSEYRATSAGSIPARCQLLNTWRGRIVLARSADEPHNWFLSKKDEPLNWDFFPPVPGETDAVAGNLSPAGLCPDIINSIVPYSEDILVFGCDHSIWMLVGDPAAGGRMELVSDITGMSFGRPWCKDPAGVLYFFGSQGGVFRWVPGNRPERVSEFKIERELSEIDLGTYFIRLAYNKKDEGIHILQCPFGAGGTLVSHWFLELKTDAFAEDVFGIPDHTNVQPTAVCVIDGDEFDDRAVLFGSEDGYVRRWDKAAKSDDTRSDGTTKIPIDGRVMFGPLEAEFGAGMETQFSGLTVVLAEAEDGARYELFASETPDSVGQSLRSGALTPGRNPPKWDRVTGPYCFVRLRNTASEERFSFERAMIRASPAGVARPRSA